MSGQRSIGLWCPVMQSNGLPALVLLCAHGLPGFGPELDLPVEGNQHGGDTTRMRLTDDVRRIPAPGCGLRVRDGDQHVAVGQGESGSCQSGLWILVNVADFKFSAALHGGVLTKIAEG